MITLALGAACLGGAYAIYRTVPTTVCRAKLRSLFVTGGIGYKRKATHSKREIVRYPQISRVSVYDDYTQAVFVLPTGLDPQEIRKHTWLFEQAFGPNIELHGGPRTFTLNIYGGDLEMYEYNTEEAQAASQGAVLPIYIGRSRNGVVAYDMAEHPHLLIAGETGSGKSVALRSILATLIQRAGDRMTLYCADMKRSEFHLFRGISEEVVMDTAGLTLIVQKLRKEMKKRGDLLDKHECANIADLPVEIRPKNIVLAIDEVALLKKERPIMDGVEEISAIGRALGVFLILAMQRPDSDVLDGKLKNNLTVRLAFRHSDEINSRITLGSGEAAHISNSDKGRAYMSLDGLTRVQTPMLGLSEAKALVAPYRRAETAQGAAIQVEDADALDFDII